MKSLRMALLAALVVAAGHARPVQADTVYMDLTFDDKTVDQPLGQGGTAIGEATWYHSQVEAYVRAAPFETPSVEFHNLGPTYTAPAQFNTPGPIFDGSVGVLFDFWFYQKGLGWLPYFELRAWDHSSLVTYRLMADGSIRIDDAETGAVTVPTYPTGRPCRIVTFIDLDTDTYSAWFDGTQYVDHRPLANTGKYFGNIMLQTGAGPAAENRFSLDRLLVTDYLPPVPVQPTTWGGIKALLID